MGRKPSKNPKGIHLGIRIDKTTADQLDGELERIKREHPGLTLNRSDIVRMLIAEAFASRKKK